MKRHLGILLLLVSALVLLAPVPTATAHLTATLVTSPTEAPALTDFTMTFTGSGFPPGEELILGLVGYTSATYGPIPADGSFSISVTFNLPAGNYRPYAATAADPSPLDKTLLRVR